MKASRPYNLLVLILILVNGIALAQPGSYYPPPSSVNYQNDTLTIYPPDSLPGAPVELISYNIYVDGNFFGNAQVTVPEEVMKYYLDHENLLPGNRNFCVAAVYNEWISENTCDSATVIYGYELPFYEDWSSGSFETLQWNTTSNHWVIESDEGNPSPDVAFLGEPGLANYEAALESYPINALGMTIGRIYINYDIKLVVDQPTVDDSLFVQIWNSSTQKWRNMVGYRSDDGGFQWNSEQIVVNLLGLNKVFKIRFLAKGANSADITGWYIDNIHVYRKCDGPPEAYLTEYEDYNLVKWDLPEGCGIDEWLRWDNGNNYGNSIGTGGAVEFDVAARWTPSQLSIYEETNIDKIAFFPSEWDALYNVRIWTGSGPDTLIYDQYVQSPVIGQWNTIIINPAVTLDISKELWVGYHIIAQTGYPAGVDDGPGVNGYGNMINFDGWKTLLEINADLDFNWNIACHVMSHWNHSEWDYIIYRKTNEEDYQFYDTAVEAGIYRDSNVVVTDHYCYKITALWMKDGDTCESDFTNEACEGLWFRTNSPESEKIIKIYPNPASSFLYIESPDQISEVRIYNMMGQCGLKVEIGNLEGKVDVSGLEEGIYFIEVVAGEKTWKNKVLIIK